MFLISVKQIIKGCLHCTLMILSAEFSNTLVVCRIDKERICWSRRCKQGSMSRSERTLHQNKVSY